MERKKHISSLVINESVTHCGISNDGDSLLPISITLINTMREKERDKKTHTEAKTLSYIQRQRERDKK